MLLGTADSGTGVFGRIGQDGESTWHHLRTVEGRTAGLLHAAFDPPGTGRGPGMWLLASSLLSSRSQDMVVHVHLDPSMRTVTGEEVAALPTQLCKAHRLLPLRRTVLASELATATVAQLTETDTCRWNRPVTPPTRRPQLTLLRLRRGLRAADHGPCLFKASRPRPNPTSARLH